MTNLQRFILSCLVEDESVDQPPGRCGRGLTAAQLAERSGGWYGNATIVRALNAMCRSTVGNADHEPRPAWAHQVDAPGVPTSGAGRQWAATADGARAVTAS